MYMADQNEQPLSEWAANACPISHSDHCRIFLSDRLLEVAGKGLPQYQRQVYLSCTCCTPVSVRMSGKHGPTC